MDYQPIIFMQQIEEAKEGLLVYLQANRQYIEEKVYNEFNVECIEQKTLETLDIKKMTTTIKDIFDFGDNEIYQYFFAQLENNIRAYIKEQYKAKAVKSFYVLDIEKLTDIIKFCITHGFDLNAAKAKHKKAQPQPVPPVPSVPPVPPVPTISPTPPPPLKQTKKVVIEAKKEQPKVEFAHVKPRISSFIDLSKLPQKKQFKLQKYTMPQTNQKPRISTFIDPSKIPEKKQFKLQKFTMPQTNVLPRYLLSIPKPQLSPKEEEPLPVVAPIDESYLLSHRKVIRQRLLKLFNFYCIQQQNLGQRPTFDRYKAQGQCMNLGRFMQFCQYTRLFSTKEMTKEMLMTEFKKAAEGKMEIQFQKFEKLLATLDEKYLKLAGHDPTSNPVPSYEARLMLNEPSKLGELKKHRNLIFGTRNKEGRELSINNSIRYGNKELTGHSGKFTSDLELAVKEKSLNDIRQPKTNRSRKSNDGPVNLADLNRLKLPKLNWIDDSEEEDSRVQSFKK